MDEMKRACWTHITLSGTVISLRIFHGCANKLSWLFFPSADFIEGHLSLSLTHPLLSCWRVTEMFRPSDTSTHELSNSFHFNNITYVPPTNSRGSATNWFMVTRGSQGNWCCCALKQRSVGLIILPKQKVWNRSERLGWTVTTTRQRLG